MLVCSFIFSSLTTYTICVCKRLPKQTLKKTQTKAKKKPKTKNPEDD